MNDPVVVAVLNAVPPRGSRAREATAALKGFGVRVCPHTLGHRAAWGDANALGLTVTEYPPRGRAGVELRQVARWLTQVLAQPRHVEGSSPCLVVLTSPRSPPLSRKPAGAARRSRPRRPAPRRRDSTVPLTVHVAPDVRTQVKVLAAERGTTVQALVCEGLNTVFAKHGRPEIAE